MATKTYPYEPHSYVEELPETARANFAVWIDSIVRGDRDAHALAEKLKVNVVAPDPFHPGRFITLHQGLLFKDVALGITWLKDYTAQKAAKLAIFGSIASRSVTDVIEAVIEAVTDYPDAFVNSRPPRDLQQRILFRFDCGTFNDLDLAWVQRKAVDQVTDEDMLGVDAFSGDQGEARELSRRVIRGRKDHTCHWTGLTIPAGEPHLVLSEVMEGDFITTRHSRLACWFHVYGGDLALAEMLKPAEPPLAAAA